MNIIFFGAGSYVLPVIKLLHQKYDLKLVVTTEKSDQSPVIAYCKQNNIPYLPVATLKDKTLTSNLKSITSPVAILANFGLIIPQSVIDIFPKGIVNLHPSLLPKYRGPTPGQTAILNGDQTSGVSIMLLDKEVDHGSILAQEEIVLDSNETADQFYQQAFATGTKLLEKVLNDYVEGKLKPKPQNHTKATFTKMLTKENGFIDPDQPIDKAKLQRMIRAYYPWPGVWTKTRIKNYELRIKFLPQEKLQVEGKKPMTLKDFLNGYPELKEWVKKFI